MYNFQFEYTFHVSHEIFIQLFFNRNKKPNKFDYPKNNLYNLNSQTIKV